MIKLYILLKQFLKFITFDIYMAPKAKKSKEASTSKNIVIRNSKVHNLKGVSVEIPRNRLTVVTGVSGSGKSSLAFDTLYAEGQRRFVESLSAYARQFLERMSKPDVESIIGLPPAIAIEQNTPSRNPRSTVGTSTEVYDYLRLLYSRIGDSICHSCGAKIRKDSPQSSAETILNWDDGDKIYILFSPNRTKPIASEVEKYNKLGFFRFFYIADNSIKTSDDALFKPSDLDEKAFFLADRLILRKDEENISRLTDSLETAFSVADGRISVWNQTKSLMKRFSNYFECADCDVLYEEPEPRLFSFNNPKGACPHCQGFGRTTGIDEDLVVPDKSLSLATDAIQPLKSPSFLKDRNDLMRTARRYHIDVFKPYKYLTDKEIRVLWDGDEIYSGIYGFFKYLEEHSYKMQNRMLLSRYRGFTKCRSCDGSRLRTSARQVFISGKNIPELINMPLEELIVFLSNIKLNDYQEQVAEQLLKELRTRVSMLVEIGLGYLNLSRMSHTLSGGESQRINLATALGSSLVGTLYVLDEPSIGMHPRDTERLLNILFKLRNLGNTIVVVEHDPDIIKHTDYIIDMGPKAGVFGGEVIYEGNYDGILQSEKSLTGKYLSGKTRIELPSRRRKITDKAIRISDILFHNLNIEQAVFPLNCLLVVTGVSGSGKSTLVHNILYAGVKRLSGVSQVEAGVFSKITGADAIQFVELVDQSPVGNSSRSTPATYTKVFDFIREVFSQTQAARQMGVRPGYFSFNVTGGRCEVCEGEGYVTVDMQFLPDVRLICESCEGTRYRKDVKFIEYNGKNIIDVLDMTIDEAAAHFSEFPKIVQKLNILQDVGLGYIKLGQPSSMLSGGESQRVRLAAHLDSSLNGHTLFIFDEPTTGLHLDDISKLLNAIQKLIDKGHSVVIIEHNLNVIAAADWIIDLGPEAGNGGGKIIAEGPPEKIIKAKNSHTAIALRDFFGSKDIV